jgi:hypothetical protein
VIRVDGHDRTVGHRVANQVFVKIDERDAPRAPARDHRGPDGPRPEHEQQDRKEQSV